MFSLKFSNNMMRYQAYDEVRYASFILTASGSDESGLGTPTKGEWRGVEGGLCLRCCRPQPEGSQPGAWVAASPSTPRGRARVARAEYHWTTTKDILNHVWRQCTYWYPTNSGSVSDLKRLFPDKDPTLKGIPDPDPTLQVFSNPISDPGENHTFLQSQRKNFVIII